MTRKIPVRTLLILILLFATIFYIVVDRYSIVITPNPDGTVSYGIVDEATQKSWNFE